MYDPSATMEDIKQWRVENFNLEKRPRKFNSWVPNRAAEEYQADLFFFDDLRQREKVQEGARTRTVREPVDYSAGLLVVDTFSKKIAVVPLERKTGDDLRPALEEAFAKMGRKPEMLYTDAEAGLTGKKDARLASKGEEGCPQHHSQARARRRAHDRSYKEPDHQGNTRHGQEVVGSSRCRCEGLQQESRQPQHADDAERRRKG